MWLAALASVALVLASAKAHGRQIRLEREREGYHSVVFGGDNPPFVEALWRADRVRFWTFTPPAALALGAWAWIARGEPAAVGVALLLAPAAGFAFAGLLSLRRLWRRGPPRAWARASAAWWSLAAALAALAVALV